MPSSLPENQLWWRGPSWLKDEPSSWPLSQYFNLADLPEKRSESVLLAKSQDSRFIQLTERFSSLVKLERAMTYVLRFISFTKNPANRCNRNHLSVNELHNARLICIKLIQVYYFGNGEFNLEKFLPKLKQLHSLSPFVDQQGLLRVGGRLENSPLSYAAKHPILLPGKCHFTTILVDYYHRCYLHAGPRLLHSLIQRRYWITSARRIIRSRIHQCLICHRLRASNITPYMGDLPPSRFEQGRAFINVGVDFAGPFLIKDSHRRKYQSLKSYVCLFVCFSTKAVHLELVSELSTDAFLAGLDRFIGRRGLPSSIYSDCGTNFIGADHRLKELWRWLSLPETQNKILDNSTLKQIKWSFSPPASPAFGGLWEAGVKSFKAHLIRVLDKRPLLFEELNTIIIRIEAMLNSRPLYPLSESPEEYDVLTPGHFLIGAPLTAIPEPDISDIHMDRLKRWKLLSHVVQTIWNKWRFDYLNSLQQRVKWKNKLENVKLGSLVILKEKNISPLSWPTARIIGVHPGRDGVVRVVTLKTAKSEIKRSVANVVPLLPQSD